MARRRMPGSPPTTARSILPGLAKNSIPECTLSYLGEPFSKSLNLLIPDTLNVLDQPS
jgi:hypothetical protein